MTPDVPARIRLPRSLHPVLDDVQAVATGALLGALAMLLLDTAIVGSGAWLSADLRRTTASLAAVAMLNLVLALNHRPGRYRAG